MNETLILEFAKAWSDKNLLIIMSFFTNDCIYSSSVGPEPGTTYYGKAEVLIGIERMLKYDKGSKSSITSLRVFDDIGIIEWEYNFNDTKIIKGCDIFQFEEGKIKSKNAFRKTFY